MPPQVIEGTWEEIKLHEAEFAGQFLRVTLNPERPETRMPSRPSNVNGQPKVLRARGMLEGLLSSEDYFREKREDTLKEDESLFQGDQSS